MAPLVLKEVVADLTLENRLLKKRSMIADGGDEASDIPHLTRQRSPGWSSNRLGRIDGRSFYRWYDRYQRGGPEALGDHPSRPDRVWNRIPERDCQDSCVRGRLRHHA